MWFNVLLVALGSALGGSIRYLISEQIPTEELWNSTMMVNVIGSFIMGICFVYFSKIGNERLALLIMVGVLGGFTTFSSFSMDVIKLLEDGQWIQGLSYVFLSVLLSLLAFALGVWSTTKLMAQG